MDVQRIRAEGNGVIRQAAIPDILRVDPKHASNVPRFANVHLRREAYDACSLHPGNLAAQKGDEMHALLLRDAASAPQRDGIAAVHIEDVDRIDHHRTVALELKICIRDEALR